MKHYTPLFFLFLISQFSFAQIDTAQLIKSAQSYTDAYINQDFDAMADMNHPNMLSFGTTKELLSKDLKTDKETLEGFGFEFKEGEVTVPTVFHESAGEVLCFVPQVFLIDISGEEYQFTKFILASSNTSGSNWSFVSLDRFDEASLGDFIPSYTSELSWPEEVSMIPTRAIIKNPLPEGAIEVKSKGN